MYLLQWTGHIFLTCWHFLLYSVTTAYAVLAWEGASVLAAPAEQIFRWSCFKMQCCNKQDNQTPTPLILDTTVGAVSVALVPVITRH